LIVQCFEDNTSQFVVAHELLRLEDALRCSTKVYEGQRRAITLG
jgi:hypothetical protein